MNAKKMLNKDILREKYNIIYVSKQGDIVMTKNHLNLSQHIITTKHTNGNDKRYKVVGPVNSETGKQENLLVHNLVYAYWNSDYDVNLDIHHINGNSLDNDLSNLIQLSRKQNLAEDCDRSEIQLAVNKIKRAKILSGKYLRITSAQKSRVKRWNRNADCFGYTNHYSYILEQDWVLYLISLNDYEKAVAEEAEMISEKFKPFVLKEDK